MNFLPPDSKYSTTDSFKLLIDKSTAWLVYICWWVVSTSYLATSLIFPQIIFISQIVIACSICIYGFENGVLTANANYVCFNF